MPKNLGYGVKSIPSLQPRREQHRPRPVPFVGVAHQRHVHDAEGQAVAEVIASANQLGQRSISGLLHRLAQYHGTKGRKDLEELERRHDAVDAQAVGEDEGQPEDVVGEGGNQTGEAADNKSAP